MFKSIIEKKLKIITTLVIQKYQPKIIAITGSVGKTSTKEAIYYCLKDSFKITKSGGNLNTEIGAPLVFLKHYEAPANKKEWIKILLKGVKMLIVTDKDYPEIVIVELGADKPGDIRYLASFIKPDIAVVTAVGETPVHVEFYQDSHQVAKEKGELLKALKKGGGAVINCDDPHFGNLLKMIPEDISLTTFGKSKESNIKISDFKITSQKNMTLSLWFQEKKHSITLKDTVSASLPYTVAAAIAVCTSLQTPTKECFKKLKENVTPPGRMKLIDGINKSLIIDGSYNASPLSTTSAINTLYATPGKRKIAVIGDMLELGEFSQEEHLKIGKLCAQKCDYLFAVGDMAPTIIKGALSKKMSKKKCFSFERAEDATTDLKNIVEDGDIILFKGSQGVRLEKVVYAVMRKKRSAHKLLVRQSEYWKKK